MASLSQGRTSSRTSDGWPETDFVTTLAVCPAGARRADASRRGGCAAPSPAMVDPCGRSLTVNVRSAWPGLDRVTVVPAVSPGSRMKTGSRSPSMAACGWILCSAASAPGVVTPPAMVVSWLTSASRQGCSRWSTSRPDRRSCTSRGGGRRGEVAWCPGGPLGVHRHATSPSGSPP